MVIEPSTEERNKFLRQHFNAPDDTPVLFDDCLRSADVVAFRIENPKKAKDDVVETILGPIPRYPNTHSSNSQASAYGTVSIEVENIATDNGTYRAAYFRQGKRIHYWYWERRVKNQ